MTRTRHRSPLLLRALLLLLPLQGCGGDPLPLSPTDDAPLEDSDYLFVEGLGTGSLEVGERRILRLGWDAPLGGSPAELSIGKDPSGALSLLASEGGDSWSLLALGEGEAFIRARVGHYVRELPVRVFSPGGLEEDGVMRTLSSRIEVDGLPREGLLWTGERCPVTILLDGEPLSGESCRIWADSLRKEALPDALVLTSAGMHVVTAEAESPQDGILYTRRAVAGIGRARLTLVAGFDSESEEKTLSHIVLFAVASFGKDIGDALPLSLKVSITAGDDRLTVFSSGEVVLSNGGILRLADYDTLKDFVISHATRRPGIEITLRPLSEWHRVGFDCSQLMELTDRYSGRKLKVVVNGQESSSGVIEPEL